MAPLRRKSRAIANLIVRTHVDAENRHDASGVVSIFHQPKYEVMPLGGTDQ